VQWLAGFSHDSVENTHDDVAQPSAGINRPGAPGGRFLEQKQ
jgi:hypothetical protein